MQNENLNNTGWKDKLEDITALPGETIPDKAAVWKKLHLRLHEKPRRKKATPYWIAAACLLLMVLIPFIRVYKSENGLVKETIRKDATTKPVIKETQPVQEAAVAIIPAAPAGKQKAVNFIIHHSSNDASSDTRKSIAGINNQQSPDNTIVSGNPGTDSIIKENIVAVPTKPKLKVVHINELGDIIEEPQDLARNTEQHAFQLKLATEEVFINTSVAAAKNGFTLLKTKASPSN